MFSLIYRKLGLQMQWPTCKFCYAHRWAPKLRSKENSSWDLSTTKLWLQHSSPLELSFRKASTLTALWPTLKSTKFSDRCLPQCIWQARLPDRAIWAPNRPQSEFSSLKFWVASSALVIRKFTRPRHPLWERELWWRNLWLLDVLLWSKRKILF